MNEKTVSGTSNSDQLLANDKEDRIIPPECNDHLATLCWIPLQNSSNVQFAVKYILKGEQLHTLVTNYRQIFYEITDIGRKFSLLNAKLTGSCEILAAKVGDLFVSPLTKMTFEEKDHKLVVTLQAATPKRILRWQFDGNLLADSCNNIFIHFTKPLLNILSTISDQCDLSSVKVLGNVNGMDRCLTKQGVQELYKAVAGSSVERNLDQDDIHCENNSNKNVGESDNDSLPPTPPPLSYVTTKFPICNTKIDEAANTQCSPQKKPKLRF